MLFILVMIIVQNGLLVAGFNRCINQVENWMRFFFLLTTVIYKLMFICYFLYTSFSHTSYFGHDNVQNCLDFARFNRSINQVENWLSFFFPVNYNCL